MSIPASADKKNIRRSPGEMILVATFATGLVYGWLYATGWTYAYHYFGRFHIPQLMMEIPKENYLLYGGIVVRHFPLWDLALVVILVAAAVTWQWFRIDAGRLNIPLSALALLMAFWLGHEAGVVAAGDQFIAERENDYIDYDRVQVWPRNKDKPPDDSPWASPDLSNGCYRLLIANQNRLFLLRPVRGAPAGVSPLVVLPWDEIEAIRVLPNFASCK